MTEHGRLYGIGVGPGDPELLTLKARRLIEAVDVVAYPNARHGRSIARGIAEPYLRDGQIEHAMTYPVTTETTDHPGGYEAVISEFYDAPGSRPREPPRGRARRRDPVRGRPDVLRLVHLPARAPRAALLHRGRPGRDVVQRRLGLGGPAPGAPRRGAHDPAGHPAARRARDPPRSDGRSRRDQARPQLRQGARRGPACRCRRARALRRARQLGRRAHAPRSATSMPAPCRTCRSCSCRGAMPPARRPAGTSTSSGSARRAPSG